MEFADFWTVRGPADEVAPLLRRAAEFLDSIGPVPVSSLKLDRGREEIAVTLEFDHSELPADLDYLVPRVAQSHFGRGQRDDVDFMTALAIEIDAETIIDLGCGTGQLATALATPGRRVIAVDPARAMLDLAGTRPGAEAVEWIFGDVSALQIHDADLVVMTGNIPSVYVSDESWTSALVAVHTALRPGGSLALGGWNPSARPWESWEFDVEIRSAGGGTIVRVPGYEIDLDDGRETLSAASEWRYRSARELERDLVSSGFTVVRRHGDWLGAALEPGSHDIVLVAQRS